MTFELDPNYEWIETQDLGKVEPSYIRGRCRHLEVTDVVDLFGNRVARLCVNPECYAQLPP